MKEIKVYHVDAFTNKSFGGNTAGVVPNAEGLTKIEMQKIARELNLSETAFLMPPTGKDNDFRVRYFTPSEEINFCGHATVGLSWIMALEYGWIKKGTQIKLETNIGMIPVEWAIKNGELDGVIMTQVTPKIKDIEIQPDIISRLIGIQENDIDNRYPINLAYTGNWHLLVPVKTAKAIDSATPLLDELADINHKYNVSTTHLFTFDSFDDGYKLYTRDFAPAVGIPEDPVTGAANGALAGYLILQGIIDSGINHEFKIAQGHAIGRPGELVINIIQGENGPIIRVGGKAVVTISGIIRL